MTTAADRIETFLSFHSDTAPIRARFAVCVKVRESHQANYLGLEGQDAEAVYEQAKEAFWNDLQDVAIRIFGKGSKVYSEGRSAGWAVPHGPHGGFTSEEIAADKALLSKCRRFKEDVKGMLESVGKDYIRPAAEGIVEWKKDKAGEAARAAAADKHEAEVLLSALSAASAVNGWGYEDDPALPEIERNLRARIAK